MIFALLFATTLMTACASSVPKDANAIRILPLGDSITRGKDDVGYRGALADILRKRKKSFRFVGELEHGPKRMKDRAHEGHNGAVIEHLIYRIDEVMTHYQPDVVLLMIGANDVETNRDLPTMANRYQTLLDKIVTARPTTHVLVSEIALIRPKEFNDLAVAFNPKIRELAEAMTKDGKHVTFVPMHDVLNLNELDSVDHPDARGNRKLAERWVKYLEPAMAAVAKTAR